MDGSASKDILQPVEQDTKDLHQGVKPVLKILGHDEDIEPESQKAFPLSEELRQIGVDAGHAVNSGFHDVVTGGSEEANIRDTDNSNVISIAVGRAKQISNKLFKKQLPEEERKAA